MSEKTSIKQGVKSVSVQEVGGNGAREKEDWLALEEPLQIRLSYFEGGAYKQQDVSITMRTPGQDGDLALGFLRTEQILKKPEDLMNVTHADSPQEGTGIQNVIWVQLQRDVKPQLGRLKTHFYTNSSCGVCGKASLDALKYTGMARLHKIEQSVDVAVINSLADTLAAEQSVFKMTGGLHAAALFDSAGKMLAVREDIGRHNAVDKLVGHCFLEGLLPMHDKILLLSGRISFELITKAISAGVPTVVAVGAPSSLAVELGKEYGMTLIGFARSGSFNIYSNAWRIKQ